MTLDDIERKEEGRIYWDRGWRRPFFVHEESTVSDFFLVSKSSSLVRRMIYEFTYILEMVCSL